MLLHLSVILFTEGSVCFWVTLGQTPLEGDPPDRDPLDRNPPGQRSPEQRPPAGQTLPCTETPSWTETPLTPYWTETPWTEKPRQRLTWTEIPWTETPLWAEIPPPPTL